MSDSWQLHVGTVRPLLETDAGAVSEWDTSGEGCQGTGDTTESTGALKGEGSGDEDNGAE